VLKKGTKLADPTLSTIIEDAATWKDDVELSSLQTYMAESDLTRVPRDVRVSFTMAHDNTEDRPHTLGQVRANFTGGYAFKAPNGMHNRSQISAEWAAKKPGETDPGQIPVAWIFVRR
jgi:hypothetical protein